MPDAPVLCRLRSVRDDPREHRLRERIDTLVNERAGLRLRVEMLLAEREALRQQLNRVMSEREGLRQRAAIRSKALHSARRSRDLWRERARSYGRRRRVYVSAHEAPRLV